MASRAGITGFGQGLIKGALAGQYMREQYEEGKEKREKRKAIKRHGKAQEEIGAFDPNVQAPPPPDIVEPPEEETARTWGYGEREAGMPSVQARDAQQQAIQAQAPPRVSERYAQYAKSRMDAAAILGQYDPEIQRKTAMELEQERLGILRTYAAQVGSGMSLGKTEKVQEAVDNFMDLAGMDLGLRAVGRETGRADAEGNPIIVTTLVSPNGQEVTPSALHDMMANLKDPEAWYKAKAEIEQAQASAERDRAYADYLAAGPGTDREGKAVANVVTQEHLTAASAYNRELAATGGLSKRFAKYADQETVDKIFGGSDKLPPNVYNQWDALTHGIIRGEGAPKIDPVTGRPRLGDISSPADASEGAIRLVTAMNGAKEAEEILVYEASPEYQEVYGRDFIEVHFPDGLVLPLAGPQAGVVKQWFDRNQRGAQPGKPDDPRRKPGERPPGMPLGVESVLPMGPTLEVDLGGAASRVGGAIKGAWDSWEPSLTRGNTAREIERRRAIDAGR